MMNALADDVDLTTAAQRVFDEKYKDCVHKTMHVSKSKNLETNFTVTFEDTKGIKFEIEITDLGEIVYEQQEIKLTDLPKAAKDTIKGTYLDARLNSARLDTRKTATIYLVAITSRDNDVLLKISQDGTAILKAEKLIKKK
jgi:hypothetical protein